MVAPNRLLGGCQYTLAVVDPGKELATTATGGDGVPMMANGGVEGVGALSPTEFVAVR